MSKQKRNYFFLFFVAAAAVLAISIAFYTIMTGQISFAFDQARDALESFSIWHDHHLKILGPTTDIPGVFHGVLWYYLLAIPYALTRAPEFAAGFIATLLFIGAFPLYKLSNKLFGNMYISMGAIVLFVLSPLFLSATRWFSNPVMALVIVPFLLLFLWNFFMSSKKTDGVLSGLLFGLLIQSEIAYAIFLITILFYLLLFRKKDVLDFIFFLGGLMLGVSTFILGEIKYHGATKGLSMFLHNSGSGHSLITTLLTIWQRIVELFAYSLLPAPAIYISGLICLFFIAFFFQVKGKEKKQYLFLFIWVFTTFISQLFSSAFSRSNYLFFPALPALCLLFIAVAYASFKKSWIILSLVICVISIFDLAATKSYILTNKSPLPVQKEAILKDAKAVVRYTYTASDKKEFAIVTMTNPLYINTTWAYLYSHYGLDSYHYLPFWAGKDQKGWIGAGILPVIQKDVNIRFLIVEPIYGIPDVYVAKIFYDEDKFSDVLEEKHFGKYIVQKRLFHKNKPLPKPPKILENSPILYE